MPQSSDFCRRRIADMIQKDLSVNPHLAECLRNKFEELEATVQEVSVFMGKLRQLTDDIPFLSADLIAQLDSMPRAGHLGEAILLAWRLRDIWGEIRPERQSRFTRLFTSIFHLIDMANAS